MGKDGKDNEERFFGKCPHKKNGGLGIRME